MTSLPSKKSRHSNNQSAFTLIELLITVVIMIISLAIGMINYFRFLDKQKLYQSGSNIETMLKDARTKAQTGFLGNESIGFCAKLAGVEFSALNTAENKVASTVNIRCADNSLLTYESHIIEERNTTIDKSLTVSFLPMRGATVILGGVSVSSGSATISRDNSTVILNLDQGGTVDVKYQ